MSWFKYIKGTDGGFGLSTFEADFRVTAILDDPDTLVYQSPSLRRRIPINNLEEDIESEEIIYIDLGNKLINEYYDENLVSQTTPDSYIVVYENSESNSNGRVVDSHAVDGIVYFKAAEKHIKNTQNSMSYAIYYGTNYIKYLEEFVIFVEAQERPVYKMIDNPSEVVYVEGSFYDLDLNDVISYSYSATTSSSKKYQLALYNAGTDWENNYSINPGAKAFGVFDGPGFAVYGETGPSSGKFKIRILSFNDNNSISKDVILDWVEVDCYNSVLSELEILYENSNLEYKKYIFEIETLSDKNIMSKSNSVKIDKYMFSPNYKLIYEKEELNPDLSFIKIGGIR